MEKGYIIFNADGSKPETTLAAIEGGGGIQTIIHLKGSDVPMLFGCIVNALVNECGIEKDLLHTIVDDAPKKGDNWADYCQIMRLLARKVSDELGEEIGELGDFEDFKGKLGKILGINTENEDK